jgi:hypothetical protein
MPPSTEALEQVLRQSPVEILHFFCHGLSSAGVQSLQFANTNDYDIDIAPGSVLLSLERLNEILVTTDRTWITVLNCCSGGMAVDQLNSMALYLTKRGSPITVGMAEPIDNNDATIFSEAFYGSLFDIIKGRVNGLTTGQSVTLDIAPAMVTARRRVHNTYQLAPLDAYGRWSLPLLYERAAPLTILKIDPAMKLRIDAVAGMLRSLPAATPDDMRTDILALLDKPPTVPLQVRPDRFGVI